MKRHKKNLKLKNKLINHLSENLREYSIIIIIFIIGIILGIIFINNTTELQKNEITEYINSFLLSLKNENTVNNYDLLIESIKKNIVIALILWLMGCSVIGIPIVYLIICFRGFCLSYTIASSVAVLGSIRWSKVLFFIFVYAKFNIYTKHICISSKWNEFI